MYRSVTYYIKSIKFIKTLFMSYCSIFSINNFLLVLTINVLLLSAKFLLDSIDKLNILLGRSYTAQTSYTATIFHHQLQM